ncbi:hypothetical protein F7Q99_36720 [Streptomyces kaniharaensis]|uniref:Uncharacterized protein n=1 Tax=Streptomyces kaniharaensis TaxID=212423 RepID=A0A6N7L303_9ACTN|nr:hypothetical protein [Streptomyces kaniharaensis]MQS17585.1 hypothetical protein [Streptomyces kaniharaensis]
MRVPCHLIAGASQAGPAVTRFWSAAPAAAQLAHCCGCPQAGIAGALAVLLVAAGALMHRPQTDTVSYAGFDQPGPPS